MTQEVCQEVVMTYLKQLRLSRMARECEAVAREAEQRGLGYLGFLQALLEGELASRQEQQLRQRLKAAAFPYQKRLEDFDFSLVPCIPKVRLLELAQGAFLAAHENVLFIGPSGMRGRQQQRNLPRTCDFTASTAFSNATADFSNAVVIFFRCSCSRIE